MTLDKVDYIPVALVLGQSNASGRGAKSNLPSFYLQAGRYSYVWQADSTAGLFNPQADSVSGNHQEFDDNANDTIQHGAEVTMIKAWENTYDSPLMLFKHAIGSTPLLRASNTTRGAWDPQENEIWHSIVREWKRMVKHLKDTYNKPIKAEFLVWCQGEADWSYVASNKGTYKAGLSRLVTAARELTGNNNLPCIIQMPVSYNATSSSGDGNWVRYEQAEFATEDTYSAVVTANMLSFYADVASFTTDGTHYRSSVFQENGFRIIDIYNKLRNGETAPTAVTNLVATPSDNSVDLSFTTTGAREYVIKINDKVHGFTSTGSITIDGLQEGSPYTAKVCAPNTSWEMAETSVSFSTTGTSPSTWDAEVDLVNAGYTGTQIKDFLQKRIGGSYTGTSEVILPDSDYAAGPHITTAEGGSWRNEMGFTNIRLTDFENNDPVGGSLNGLRSEIKVATRLDSSGKCLFYGNHKSLKWIVWELDTVARTVSYLGEVDTGGLDGDYHHTIMPHPDEDDTVMFADENVIKKCNLRTGTITTMYTLPFTPAVSWGKKDGNGLWYDGTNDVIVCSEADGPHKGFMLKMSTGEAVNTVNGVTTVVPIASRQTITFIPSNNSDLDHVFTDGKYMYAVHKNGSGPGGRSGLLIYDSAGFIEEIPGSGTGHYSHQWAELGGTKRFSVTWKLTPGNATELGSPYDAGDIVTSTIDISYSSGYTVSYDRKRSLIWNYSTAVPSGGQNSGIDSIENVAALAKGTAHTDSNNGSNGSYIDEAFFGKEEIFLFHLKEATENQYTRIAKTLTRLKISVSNQSEMNLLAEGADGTIYLVYYSRIGPIKGSTTYVNPNDKDCWLVIVPPQMPDDRIDYYLAL